MKSESSNQPPGIVFLQIAVQKTAQEVGGIGPSQNRKRKLALAVLYSTALDDYRVYTEAQVVSLLDTMKSAEFVVGYNCLGFDYEVLRGYSVFQCPPTLDLFRIFHETMGFGVSLDNMACSTLGGESVSDGNEDTALWKACKLDALIDRCKQDVDLMRRIHKHGMEHKSICFTNKNGVHHTVPIQWETVQPTEYMQFPSYTSPSIDILEWHEPVGNMPADKNELIEIQETIISTMATFGIMVKPGDITRGPTVTRYEVYPTAGLSVSRIASLEPDIARATGAERIHIIAPIPGKDTVGIEIANNKKVLVPLRELLEDSAFTSSKKKIPLALGKDVYGNVIVGDLAAMPHLLVAGAKGSGKSVCIHSIIASMLFRFTPDELRLIMVDPKVVEMVEYNTLPHLVAPVVTDAEKVIQALRWVVIEMERRYRMFAMLKVSNFDAFNNRPKDPKPESVPEPDLHEGDEEITGSIFKAPVEGGLIPPNRNEDPDEPEDDALPERIPYIVVIIDELADLMQTASADVEMLIARIAQKARAAGIHLIVATQTPRATVVTGVIKANIPCRIAFQVSSGLDSRVILDLSGAEKLVGKGDMLYLPPGSAQHLRCQGAFITDEEVHHLVRHCSNQG